jgi:uncharacterized membrane protein YoaT (DUF817 family)
MTPEQRKVVTLSSLSLCGLIVCVFFTSRHSAHHAAITFFSSFGLLFINSWLVYLVYSSNRRMPDTLIHLFPQPPATHKERS